jgi:hypothetical protein
VNALHGAPDVFGTGAPNVVGGRYGLSSKEFTPAMVKAVYDNLARPEPKGSFHHRHQDDVTTPASRYDSDFSTEPDNVVRALFYGLGADGTVGANKNSIKIIGENTDNYGQGYFVYDSKKSGAMTVSHLRFGPQPIRSSYLIKSKLRRLPSMDFSRALRHALRARRRWHVPALEPISIKTKSGIIFRASAGAA